MKIPLFVCNICFDSGVGACETLGNSESLPLDSQNPFCKRFFDDKGESFAKPESSDKINLFLIIDWLLETSEESFTGEYYYIQ